ncbi:hypothetical protein [Paenibacillus sp. FSL K6-0108]|uniref:hypothetical protein n=1 Tax=Paenibacillus sp. FSL K6-0108 TaxID=2921417 RepID=UPI00324E43F1
MKRIVFSRNKGIGHRAQTEVIEFDDVATEEDIRIAYVDWVWEQVNDEFTWYEEEDGDQT